MTGTSRRSGTRGRAGGHAKVGALVVLGERAHGGRTRGRGVGNGDELLAEDRIQRHAIAVINASHVVDAALGTRRHGEGRGVERARTTYVGGVGGPAEQLVGARVGGHLIGGILRQRYSLARLGSHVRGASARQSGDVGHMVIEVQLLGGLGVDGLELVGHIHGGGHIVAAVRTKTPEL